MSVQQAKDAATNVGANIWELRMAILMFVIFSASSLCTCIIAALTGAVWANMDGQTKFMICLIIFVNWSGTVTAFISKQSARIKKTGELFPDDDDGAFVVKQKQTTTSVEVGQKG